MVLRDQGVEVKADAEFRPITGDLIYNISARPESKYKPIGYVEQGQSRVFSNVPTPFSPSYAPSFADPSFIGQQMMQRSQSASRLEPGRFNTRLNFPDPIRHEYQYQPESESYIKELSNPGRQELRRPFEILEQSQARLNQNQSQGNQGQGNQTQSMRGSQTNQGNFNQHQNNGNAPHPQEEFDDYGGGW